MLCSTIRSLSGLPAVRVGSRVGRTIASAIRAARTFARTSWTRTTSAPAATPRAVVASVASSRSSGPAGRGPGRGSTCATCRGGSGGRAIRRTGSSRRRTRLCSGVFPKPNPGSIRIESHATPARSARSIAAWRSAEDLGHQVRVARPRRGCASGRSGRVARRPGGAGRRRRTAPDVVDEVRPGGDGRRRGTSTFVVSTLSGIVRMGGSDAPRTTGIDAGELLGRASTTAWPGRVDSPPMSRMSAPSSAIRRAMATAAATARRAGQADRVAAEPGRARRRQQAVAGEGVRGHVDDAHDERARPPGEAVAGPTRRGAGGPGMPGGRAGRQAERRRRRTAAAPGRAATMPRSSGAGSVIGLDCRPDRGGPGRRRDAPGPRRRGTGSRPRSAVRAGRPAPVEGGVEVRLGGRPTIAAPPRARSTPRPGPGQAAAGSARGSATSVATIRAPASAARPARAATTPAMSLSAIDAVRQGRTDPSPRNGRRSSSAGGQGGGARGVVGPVEQDVATGDVEQLETARPARLGVAAPPGVVRHAGDPGGLERVEDRVRDRDVGRLVPAAQPDPGRAEAGQLDDDPVAVDRHDRRRLDDRQRDAEPTGAAADDRPRLAGRAGHRPIAALDDRRLLPGDVARSSGRAGPCGRGRRS